MVVFDSFIFVLGGEDLSSFSYCHSSPLISPHLPERKHYVAIKSMDSDARLPLLKPWPCHLFLARP